MRHRLYQRPGHNYFADLLWGIVLCLTICSSKLAYAPTYPPTLFGKILTSPNQPLIISTYNMAYDIYYSDNFLSSEFAGLGFIHANSVFTDLFSLLNHNPPLAHNPEVAAGEVKAIRQTQNVLEMSAASGEALATNGRIVLVCHGTRENIMSFDFMGTSMRTTPEKLGYDLGVFLQKNNISAKYIDVHSCCGDVVIPDTFAGLKRSGLTNFTIRGVRGGPLTDSTSNQTIFYIDNKTYSTDTYGFVIKGKLPDNLPKNDIIMLTEGQPEPVTQPRIIERPGCTIL